MEYILDIFYEYIYEPIYYTFERYFQNNHINRDFIFMLEDDISQQEIDKLLNETIYEIKQEQEMKELEMRFIELTKEDNDDKCIKIDDHSDDDDDNENALLVKRKIPILI